jgi:hypothetical protein
MRALKVTAYTPDGFCTTDPWSPTLDGILAHCLKRKYGRKRLDPERPIAGLPLELVQWGSLWWYVASSPRYSANGFFVHEGESGTDNAVVENATSISWHTVGSKKKIVALLKDCTHIGKHRNLNMGGVSHWEVTPNAESEALGRYERPVPVDYAMAYSLPKRFLLIWGISPPAWPKEHQCMCAMPKSVGEEP